MVKERSSGSVIFRREGKKLLFLLLHYEFKTDYWDFPKGNIEAGETEEDAAKSEIKEETGLVDISFIPNFKEKINYVYKKDGETIFKEVFFFLAESRTKDVEISYEHTGYEWVDYQTAMKRLKENSKKVLMKANDFLNKGLSKWV